MSASIFELASTTNLFVVTDFDGTIAEFSTDPNNVPVNHEAVAALDALAALPQTTVAVLSGRDLETLKKVSGFANKNYVLAGSHGAETSEGNAPLTPEHENLLERVTDKLEDLASNIKGAFVEHKPYHRVLHTIAAEDKDSAAQALAAAQELKIPGTTVKPGKYIVEVGVTSITKGTWLKEAIQKMGATGTVFMGDDTTDEDGFKVLGPNDLSVKVGDGDTHANMQVADVKQAGEFLARLATLRDGALKEAQEQES